MTLDDLKTLRDAFQTAKTAETQAQAALDALRAAIARLEAEAARLILEISQTSDFNRRQRLIQLLARIQQDLQAANAQLPRTETRLANAATTREAAEAAYEAQLAGSIAQIDADVPVALLPVRLETKFVDQGGSVELRVRVYPDDIQVNAHEPNLTPDEWKRGEAFHQAAGGSQAAKQQAWADLAGRLGPWRAAWVARQTDPSRAGQHDREISWTLGERATALPDVWYFIGYGRQGLREERLFVEHGDLILDDPLPLWYDSQAKNAQEAEKGVAWLTDFTEAKRVGMAHSIQLTKEQAGRLNRLVVVGVKATADEVRGGKIFEDLLEAHHYTWGLGFVPQGTPTNNTTSARSGFQEHDPRFSTSFALEQHPFGFRVGQTPAQDGVLAARALGFTAPTQAAPNADFVFAHVAGGSGHEQLNAAAINRALWPATWGYFLQHMMFPQFLNAPLEDWQEFFIRTVRGRGPLPALRAGNQPYGLLPVTSLNSFASRQQAPDLLLYMSARTRLGLREEIRVGWDIQAEAGRISGWEQGQALPPALEQTVLASHLTLLRISGGPAADLALTQVVAHLTQPNGRQVLLRTGSDLQENGGGANWGPETVLDAPDAAADVQAVGVCLSQTRTILGTVLGLDLAEVSSTEIVLTGRPLTGQPGTLVSWAKPTIIPNDFPGLVLRLDLYRPPTRMLPRESVTTLLAWVDQPGGPVLYQKDIIARAGVGNVVIVARPAVAIAGSQDIARGGGLVAPQTTVAPLEQGAALMVLLLRFTAQDELVGQVVIGSGFDFNGGVEHWVPMQPTLPLAEGVQAAALAVAPLGWRKLPSFSSGTDGFVGLLLHLREIWKRGIARAPHLQRVTAQDGSVDVDKNLIETLGMTPGTHQAAGRQLLGPSYLRNLLWYQTGLKQGQYANWETNAWQRLVQNLLAQSGGVQARMGLDPSSVLSQSIYTAAHFPYTGPLVMAEGLSETERLKPDYIAELLDATPQAIHLMEGPDTLLFHLLRDAVLQAYAEAAMALSDRPHQDEIPWPHTAYHEPELVDLPDLGDLAERRKVPNTFTSWRHLHAAQVNGQPFDRYIATELVKDESQTHEAVNKLRRFRQALEQLSALPTAELQRLVSECLDLSSHRLDAWITAFATERLHQMRGTKSTGLTLGGYGWVEWKTPPTAPVLQSAGYIQAPSLAHAATAAVLRSSYLSHNPDGSGKLLALDLSSRRVRTATYLMDGMREGQPLGALLGYRFERRLYERSREGQNPPNLMQYLDNFRAMAPLVAKKLSSDNGQPSSVEAEAARNVVDGLALLNKRAGDVAAFLATLSSPTERNATNEVLDDIADALDSVSDLVVAESVYQAVQGNPSRSGASLAAIAAGEVPIPEADVARSARSGVGVTHRLLLAFNAPPGSNNTLVKAWASQPRGQAEPVLNAWAAHLFGDPSQIVYWVTFLGSDGRPLAPPIAQKQTLDALNLCPLDLLYAQPLGELAQRSYLEQRLLYDADRRPLDARALAGALRDLAFTDPGDPQSAQSTGEIDLLTVMEVARVARDVVGSARAMSPGDLAWPRLHQELGVDAAEIEGRRSAARRQLDDALKALKVLFPLDAGTHLPVLRELAGITVTPNGITSLLDLSLPLDWQAAALKLNIPSSANLEAIRAALLALAAFGLDGAFPVSATGSSAADGAALFVQARQAAAQAQTRLNESDTITLPTTTRIEALFGGGFRALQVFTPPAELGQAINRRTQAADASPSEILPWFQQSAQVRPAATRLETLLMYVEANSPGAIQAVQAAQLPLPAQGETDTWIAGKRTPFQGGRVSLVLFQPLRLDPAEPLAGLALDEWVEIVPNSEETTAVTFHYDAPGARPPQSILLAVTPQDSTPWSLDILASTLVETLELAKLRAVDLHSLPDVGHFLPALFLAWNHGHPDPASNPTHDPLGDTISTNLIFDEKGKSIWVR